MNITINDKNMMAYAVTIAEDGRKVSALFEVFDDDTVEDLISRATDKLSDAYLHMCSPLM